MKHTYKIVVNEEHEFAFNENDIEALDVHQISEHQLHVLFQGESFVLDIKEADFHQKNYLIQRGSKPFEVAISNPLDALIASMGFSLDTVNDIQQISAPMPGLILDIHVEAGQEVNEDDPLLILEAMKMENVVASPRAGIIKEVLVKKGAAVDKSQVLIEFEND